MTSMPVIQQMGPGYVSVSVYNQHAVDFCHLIVYV